MTDKLSKELAKLGAKELEHVAMVLRQIRVQDLQGLNVTKLKGHHDIFRVRKGRLRIIYRQNDGAISVLAIERRSEKTYRDF